MGIGLDKLRPSKSPFHGVAPGKRVQPLGQIDLPVCFGTAANFRKEVLTFEVVGFRGSYHAILGRPCYAKFMAVPNYTYLKLKMLRHETKTRYPQIQKLLYAVVLARRKLCHYFEAHPVTAVSSFLLGEIVHNWEVMVG